MGCNKEEAIREMEIAVKRLYDRDYDGAKQIALKVESLFPQLDNISQLLAVCEVHSSAQLMANGLHDWYKIIQVDPVSDDIQIRKQYRKLALVLHPDKNKFPGAEAAFKLVGEANNTLSDRAKRVVYDLKRRHLVWLAESPENAQTNGAKNSSSSNFNRAKKQKSRQQPPPQPQGLTFWTECPFCNTRYQYYQQILSKTVCCTCCSKKFRANALPHVNPGRMSGVLKRPQQFPGQQPHMSASYRPPMKSENNLNSKPTVSNSSSLNTVTGQSKTVTADTNKPPADPFPNQYSDRSYQCKFNPDVNSSRGDSDQIHRGGHAVGNSMPLRSHNKPDVKRNGTDADNSSPAKKARVEVNGKQDGNDGMDASNTSTKASTTVEMEVNEQDNKEKGNDQVGSSVSDRDQTSGGGHAVCTSIPLRRSLRNKPDVKSNGTDTDVLSPALKASVEEKGAQDGENRMDAFNTCSKADITGKREVKEQNRENGNKLVGSGWSVRDKDVASGTANVDTCLDSSPEIITGAPLAPGSKISQQSVAAENLYGYPDPEFHNFDGCRTHSNFHRGQIWALYSELDTYPKYYGWIQKVQHEPFKVHVSWLEACPWLKERGWLDSDLPISCGNFKVSNEKMIYDKSDYFSHMVTVCERGQYYEILPKVGEIWAVYKDWSARWTLHDLETCEFHIVQIRKQREESLVVLPMRKVPQYKSVFKPERVDGSGLNTWEVPAFMFSHRIPAICLTEEQGGKLRGFWELDPASVPYAFFNHN